MTIADRIRDMREGLGLSQLELAIRAGYQTKGAISKIELSGDDITLKKVSRIAKALGTSESFLMGWDSAIAHADTDFLVELTLNESKHDYAMKLCHLPKEQFDCVCKIIDTFLVVNESPTE